jgi:hypothetical protein
MSYTLIIGDIKSGQIAEVTNEQAPAIEGAGPHSRMNKSQPSYSGMEDLCSQIGLRQMFFEELLVKRPGVAPLTARHAGAQSALRASVTSEITHKRSRAMSRQTRTATLPGLCGWNGGCNGR